MHLRGYLGDRKFYKMVMIIALPIILQNFVTNLVNMIDNLMVGSLGTEEMSAVSIVNQLIFVYNLSIFGALGSAGIFTSQYYGKGDILGIRYTIRFKFINCVVIIAISFALLIFAKTELISLYLHEGSQDCDLSLAMDFAKQYLDIMLIGLIPYAFSQLYASTLKETGETFVPMAASITAVVVNTVINYFLIFGVWFFPKLGVRGAAVGTVISRFAEFGIIYIYVMCMRKKHSYFKGAFKSLYIPLNMLKNLCIKGIPLMTNEFIWAVGTTALTIAYSNYGLAVVAGQSISATIVNLINMIYKSLGITIGIIAGHNLGAREYDKAVDNVKKLNFFALLTSIALAAITIFIAHPLTGLYNVSAESKMIAVNFIIISALFMPFVCVENSAYFTLRAGGRVLITTLFDGAFVLFVSAPMALVCQSIAPVFVTYFAVQMTSVLKAVLGTVLVNKRVWVRNIVN